MYVVYIEHPESIVFLKKKEDFHELHLVTSWLQKKNVKKTLVFIAKKLQQQYTRFRRAILFLRKTIEFDDF